MTHQNQPPQASLAAQVQALKAMSVEQLREEYEAAFGEQPKSANRQHLYRRIAWQMRNSSDSIRRGVPYALKWLPPLAAT